MSKIREARKALGISQGQLALMLGVTPGAVGQWEHGQTRPRAEKLLLISSILGVPVEELLRAG